MPSERARARAQEGSVSRRHPGHPARGTPYNLPIELVINAGYPRRPPKAFVRPTPGHDDPRPPRRTPTWSGVVYLPYLSPWQPRCDLVRLVQETSTTFGNDPPLFARPQNQPVQRIPTTPISPSVQIKQDATARVRRAASLRLAQLKAAIDVELKAQQKLHALTDSAADVEQAGVPVARARADAAVLELGAAQDQLRRWYAATYEGPAGPITQRRRRRRQRAPSLGVMLDAIETRFGELDAALADGRVGFDDFIRDVVAPRVLALRQDAPRKIGGLSPDRGVYASSKACYRGLAEERRALSPARPICVVAVLQVAKSSV